jgi:hypothetical protein
MPGIDARAPERTETSSGLAGSPNFLPTDASTLASPRRDLGFQIFGILPVMGVEIGAKLSRDW